MTTPAPPARPPAPGGGFLPADKRKRQQLAIGAAAVSGVVILALYRKSHAAASSGTSGSSSTGTSTTGTSTPYSYGGSFSGSGEYATQLAAMQNQLAALVAAENPSPAAVAASNGSSSSSGDGSSGPSVHPLLGGAYSGPNVRGMSLASAKAALASAGFSVNNVSGSGSKVYSFTPYSNGSVNIGLT